MKYEYLLIVVSVSMFVIGFGNLPPNIDRQSNPYRQQISFDLK